jgi:hypothetical protein
LPLSMGIPSPADGFKSSAIYRKSRAFCRVVLATLHILPFAPEQGVVVKPCHLIKVYSIIATTPPLWRLARALRATCQLGAKVMARSSYTGGISSSLPIHVAPESRGSPNSRNQKAQQVHHAQHRLHTSKGATNELRLNRRKVAFNDMQVCTASSASRDPDQHIAWFQFRTRYVLD